MAEREAEIRALFPMVRTIARRVAHVIPGADFDDLIGDGCFGLIRAVNSYDPGRGIPLRSYARRVVAGAMLNGVRRMDPVSERVRRTMRRAEAERMERAQTAGRLPSLAEMEQIVPGFARARDLAYRHAPLSLDGPLAPESALSGASSDPAHAALARAERAEIAGAVAALPARQRRLLVLHYWNGVSLRAVSKELMVSPQRVSQLHLAALQTLRRRIAAP